METGKDESVKTGIDKNRETGIDEKVEQEVLWEKT